MFNLTSEQLSSIIAIFSVVFSVVTYNNKKQKEIISNRYFNIIFPIFDLLEPTLFTSYCDDINEKIIIILEEQKPIIGGRLNIFLFNLRSNTTDTDKQETYISLCQHISHELDKCCQKLYIPKRSIHYRFYRKQYKNNLFAICYVLMYTSLLVITGIVFFSAFLLIKSYLLNLITI